MAKRVSLLSIVRLYERRHTGESQNHTACIRDAVRKRLPAVLAQKPRVVSADVSWRTRPLVSRLPPSID